MTVFRNCRIITDFCDELIERVPEWVDFLIAGSDRLRMKHLQQAPERFACENLVWPLLNSVGLDYVSEPYIPGQKHRPDLLIRNTKQQVVGECKPLNRHRAAAKDLKQYLTHPSTATKFGIATDGIDWLFVRQPYDGRRKLTVLESHTFRPAIFQHMVEEGMASPELEGDYIGWLTKHFDHSTIQAEELTQSAQRFEENFSPTNLDYLIHISDNTRLDDFN